MDDIDALNERAAKEAEWLRRDQEVMEARRAAKPLTFCEDCEEDLTPARRAIFAMRCYECQVAYERRTRQYREKR